MVAIELSFVGLWGCQFPAFFASSANPNQTAQSQPLPAISPTPAPSSATESINSPVAVAQRATDAAARARVAADKAAAASKAAEQAFNEAERAAAEADLAAGITPPKPTHRRKLPKRPAAVASAPAASPAAAPAATSPSPAPVATIATGPASSLSSPTADPSPAPSTITSSEPDLVSPADAAELHSSQEDAAQSIDNSTSALKNVNRDQLGAQDAERYDQASRLLQSARAAMAEQDYVAAHSLARKAAVLIRLLSPAKAQ